MLPALFAPIVPCLCVTHQGALALALPLQKGERFSIEYTHSVNRSPVIDTLSWEGGQELIVRTSLFQTYGAGIPAANDGVGTASYSTPDGILITGIDAPHREISLLTGTYGNHRLLYRSRSIALKEIFGEKELIVLSARHLSILQTLWAGKPSPGA